jgi:hypothetical protein
MLNSSGLPFEFWRYAQQLAAYLHNRIPHSRIAPKTPIKILFNQQPTSEFIFPFGAHTLVFLPAKKQDNKFSDQPKECFLVGYPPSGRDGSSTTNTSTPSPNQPTLSSPTTNDSLSHHLTPFHNRNPSSSKTSV